MFLLDEIMDRRHKGSSLADLKKVVWVAGLNYKKEGFRAASGHFPTRS